MIKQSFYGGNLITKEGLSDSQREKLESVAKDICVYSGESIDHWPSYFDYLINTLNDFSINKVNFDKIKVWKNYHTENIRKE
jgi:hypothetical protein